MAARLFHLLVLGVALLPFRADMASADDGPPRTLLSAAGRLRPAQTVERMASAGPVRLLVSVRGYGATANDRGYWMPIYAATPDMDHADLGIELGNYDTRGSLSASGDELRRAIRRRVREDDVETVAIVSISQGGNVTDAAFRSGLSSRDNVTTWTTIASPLNGSTTARAIRDADRLASLAGAHQELAGLLAPLHAGLDDPALADLAERRSFTPPAGVRFTQFWATGDELVLDADASVAGATRRTLTPLPFIGPGHGGQVKDARTREMIVASIRGKDPAISAPESLVADLIAPLTDEIRRLALCSLTLGFVSAAVALASAKLIRRKLG